MFWIVCKKLLNNKHGQHTVCRPYKKDFKKIGKFGRPVPNVRMRNEILFTDHWNAIWGYITAIFLINKAYL